jgi:hypothetical protein
LFLFGGAKIEQKSKPPKLFAKKNAKKMIFLPWKAWWRRF